MRVKRTACIAVTVLFVSGLVACSASPGGGADLDGTSWVLHNLAGRPPLPGRQVTLSFSADSASGNATCNSFGGGYTVSGRNSIAFTDLSSTMMACLDAGVMEQEALFLRALGSASRYAINGSQLEIQTAEGALVFNRQ